MKLSDTLQKELKKVYEPTSMIDMKIKGHDVSFKTDKDGNPVIVFVGKRNEQGVVKGERFVRTLKKDNSGNVIKDHWELKGKAS